MSSGVGVEFEYLAMLLQEQGPIPPDGIAVIRVDPDDGIAEAEGYEAVTLKVGADWQPTIVFHKTLAEALQTAADWSKKVATRDYH